MALTVFIYLDEAKSYDTVEEIDNLTVDDVLSQVLQNGYPDCVYTVEDGQDFIYGNLIEPADKPECVLTVSKTANALEAIKDAYKYQLTLKQKKAEAKTKFLQVRPYFYRALQKAGLIHISNPEAWFRDKVRRMQTHGQVDTAITKLDSLINQIPAIEAEDQTRADAEAVYDAAKEFMKTYNCDQLSGVQKAICIVVKGR